MVFRVQLFFLLFIISLISNAQSILVSGKVSSPDISGMTENSSFNQNYEIPKKSMEIVEDGFKFIQSIWNFLHI